MSEVHKVGQRDQYDLQFFIDHEMPGLWFRIFDRGGNSVSQEVTISQFFDHDITTKYGGDVDEFFIKEAMVKANTLLESFFGKADDQPPTDMYERLVWNIRKVSYNEAANMLELK